MTSFFIKNDFGFDKITGIPKLIFADKSISAIKDISETFDLSNLEATSEAVRKFIASGADRESTEYGRGPEYYNQADEFTESSFPILSSFSSSTSPKYKSHLFTLFIRFEVCPRSLLCW